MELIILKLLGNLCFKARVQIHANCRIRRIYFTDQLLSSKKIPEEYKAFSNVEENNIGGNMGGGSQDGGQEN